jgi:hypothetical protein
MLVYLVFFPICISHFSCCCDKIPGRNSLRDEGFILVHGSRGFSPSWQGEHGGAEKFTSLWPEAREKGIQEDARSKYGPKGLAPTSSH